MTHRPASRTEPARRHALYLTPEDVWDRYKYRLQHATIKCVLPQADTLPGVRILAAKRIGPYRWIVYYVEPSTHWAIHGWLRPGDKRLPAWEYDYSGEPDGRCNTYHWLPPEDKRKVCRDCQKRVLVLDKREIYGHPLAEGLTCREAFVATASLRHQQWDAISPDIVIVRVFQGLDPAGMSRIFYQRARAGWREGLRWGVTHIIPRQPAVYGRFPFDRNVGRAAREHRKTLCQT